MIAKELTKETVQNIFRKSEDPIDAVKNLYSYVLGIDWDSIDRVEGWPKVSQNTALMIMSLAGSRWDPIAVNMLWLNRGFSTDKSIKDNIVIYDENIVQKKDMSDPITMMFAQKGVEEQNPTYHEQEDL